MNQDFKAIYMGAHMRQVLNGCTIQLSNLAVGRYDLWSAKFGIVDIVGVLDRSEAPKLHAVWPEYIKSIKFTEDAIGQIITYIDGNGKEVMPTIKLESAIAAMRDKMRRAGRKIKF